MEVILRQAVENLGHPGDLVKVSAGFARNYLLPRGVAVAATEGNKKRIAQEKARLEAAEAARRQTAEEYAATVEQISLTFSARVGEEGKLFGSVTSADIAHQLEAQGYKIEKRQIDLNEPIKALGVHDVEIALHPEVSVKVRLNVARSEDEAERQARGEDVTVIKDEALEIETFNPAEMFEGEGGPGGEA